MSLPSDREPTPELTTTRIGGGRRAWVIALGAVVVLGLVVYLGLSGKSAAPGASSAPASSNLVGAASPGPSPTPSGPLTEVESVRADPTAPVLYQYLGTALTLNGHGTLAILDAVGPNEYKGMYRIPYSMVTPTAVLEFDAVTASVSHDDLDRMGTWTLPLNLLNPGAPAAIVLDESEPPQDRILANPDFQGLAKNGYHLTATTQGQADAGLLTIDVSINPDEIFAADDYFVSAQADNGGRLVVPLDDVGHGSYDGQAPSPQGLLGSTAQVTLKVVPAADSSHAAVDVGTWPLQVPARARGSTDRIELQHAGAVDPTGEPQIIANGYYLQVEEVLVRGHLYLRVILTVNPTSGVADTGTRHSITGDDGLIGWPIPLQVAMGERPPTR